MAERIAGEVLMETLAEMGVRRIFAIPDGTYNICFKWVQEHGEAKDVKFITPRHEAAGAHMADGWFRVTGTPTVVMAGAGPGAANLISGVIAAQVEEVPMVVITSQRRTSVIQPPRGAMQVFDQGGAYSAVTKASFQVLKPERLPELLHKAFSLAQSDVPGPVHLDIPEDILNGTFNWQQEKPLPVQPVIPGGDPQAIKEAARLLWEANTPMIHAGGAVLKSGAWEELRELAEYLGAPVSTSPAGRGAIAEDHPLCVPTLCIGARVALAQSDLCLALGCRFGELEFWGRPPLWAQPESQKLIHVHIAAQRLGENRKPDIAILGHLKPVLRGLLLELERLGPPRPQQERMAAIRQTIQAWEKDLKARYFQDKVPLIPGRVIQEVRSFFPREAIMVMDGGNTCLWCVHLHPVLEPRTFLWTSEFGHLGTGLPYAIGAKLAQPQKTVYLISGDSAFGFNLQELETAKRVGASIVAVVMVDGAWGMEKASQRRVFGNDSFLNCDHEPLRYDLVAQAMGCFGAYVREPGEIRPALEAAVASALPAVLHVEVDPAANVDPPGMELWVGSHAG
ncbi:MAG: thiamine pyrophosphate-binding protein [bacterium]